MADLLYPSLFTSSPGLMILFTHSLFISQIFPHTLKIVHLSMRNARFQLSHPPHHQEDICDSTHNPISHHQNT